MIHKVTLIGSLAGLGILLEMPSHATISSQHPQGTIPTLHGTTMQPHVSKQREFHYIDQPLWAKAAVTAGGLGLMGLELWWFLHRSH